VPVVMAVDLSIRESGQVFSDIEETVFTSDQVELCIDFNGRSFVE
jgi:hypothetical protein